MISCGLASGQACRKEVSLSAVLGVFGCEICFFGVIFFYRVSLKQGKSCKRPPELSADGSIAVQIDDA